jgi:hypothetical protein
MQNEKQLAGLVFHWICNGFVTVFSLWSTGQLHVGTYLIKVVKPNENYNTFFSELKSKMA